jgi:hypothetical protein
MHDAPPSPAEPQPAAAKLYRIGCTVNVILFLLMAGVIVYVSFSPRARGTLTKKETNDIHAVLDAQVAAWNTGDLDGFMAGYWHDDKLSFTSGDRVTQGWEATRDRYQKKYFTPDKDGKLAERGELSFADLQIEGVGGKAAVVRGRYILKLEKETAMGRFTLLFRKFPDGWKITSDHTSAADKPPEKKE